MVTHTGYTVPYQLHCCAQGGAELRLELEIEEGLDDEIELGVDDLDEEATEAEEGTEDEAGPPAHTAPLIEGRSSAPPFLFNWKPKLTV